MKVLTSKQYLQYDYISRYASFPIYYHTLDDKWIYGITEQLSNTTTFVTHILKDRDTLDTLALKYYGRPDLFWVIADYNHIRDPYINLIDSYTTIKIPAISSIDFED